MSSYCVHEMKIISQKSVLLLVLVLFQVMLRPAVSPRENLSVMSFFDAITTGNVKIVQSLIDDKANIHQQGKYGMVPLSDASVWGHSDIVQLLLNYRADVNHQEYEGKTSLMWASKKGHSDIVQLLLDNKADVNHQDHDSRTPLSGASCNGHSDIVQLLLDSGADVNHQDRHGDSLLFLANHEGRHDIVKLLLNYGAEVKDPSQWHGECFGKWIEVNGKPDNDALKNKFADMVFQKKEDRKLTTVAQIMSTCEALYFDMPLVLAQLIVGFTLDPSCNALEEYEVSRETVSMRNRFSHFIS